MTGLYLEALLIMDLNLKINPKPHVHCAASLSANHGSIWSRAPIPRTLDVLIAVIALSASTSPHASRISCAESAPTSLSCSHVLTRMNLYHCTLVLA